MDNQDDYREPPQNIVENPIQPPLQLPQPQKPNSSEVIKQIPTHKNNYHFKDEQPTKPLLEAKKHLEQPIHQKPSNRNKNPQS